MSLPNHHLPPELLLGHATGTLTEALDVFVATHLTLCPACRAEAEALDSVGGALLATEDPAPVPQTLLQAVLTRIAAPQQVPDTAPPGDPVFPRPLLRYTGSSTGLRWGLHLFGCRRMELPLEHEGRPARLLAFQAGVAIPHHGHQHTEYSLVLSGGYRDAEETYARGDVAVQAPGTDHRPVVDDDGPCWLLLLHGGALVPKGLTSRLGTWFIDR